LWLFSILIFFVSGFLCALSTSYTISSQELSLKAVLDVLHFPGAIFLLLCTYNVSKYEDNDGENEECLYVPLSDQLNEVDPISHVTPFAKAGFFSKISFIVQKKTLKDEDIPKLPESDQAESCYLFVFCRSIEQAEKKGTIVTKIVFVGNNSVTSERDFDVRTFCFAQGTNSVS